LAAFIARTKKLALQFAEYWPRGVSTSSSFDDQPSIGFCVVQPGVTVSDSS
jgi:hypothetical protein